MIDISKKGVRDPLRPHPYTFAGGLTGFGLCLTDLCTRCSWSLGGAFGCLVDIIQPTQRRRERRQRALARHQWWRYKNGFVQSQHILGVLKAIYKTLSSHHSRDTQFIKKIKSHIGFYDQMAAHVNSPWRCLPCKRLCKATAVHCPSCGKPWSKCYDKQYVRNNPVDNSWSWTNTAAREASPRSRRARSTSERSRKGKGKGKKQAKGDTPALQGYSLPVPPAAPWMPEVGHGEAAFSSSNVQMMDSELLAAIKRSYPDASQMPSEIKAMVEKSQGMVNKQTTRDLHLATTQLGKAKKCLDELTESRGAHRQAWMKYLKECTDSLTQQQEKFNDQEKQFTELMENGQRRDQKCTREHTDTQCTRRGPTSGDSSISLTRSCSRRVERITTASGSLVAKKQPSVAGHQGGEVGDDRSFYGGRRGPGFETKITIKAQIYRSFTSFFLKNGSVLSRLRRLARQPIHVTFQAVEAHDEWDHRAACRYKGKDAAECNVHSVMLEDDYIDPWHALLRASRLAGSLVLESMSQDIFGFFCELSDIGCQFRLQDDPPHPNDEFPIESERRQRFLTPTTEGLGHIAPFCQLMDAGVGLIREFADNSELGEEVELVTFGLLQSHVGKRIGACPPTARQVMEEAARLWEDYREVVDLAILHVVRPQLNAPRMLTIIVELLLPAHPPPFNSLPVLRYVTSHGDGHTSEEATYHSSGATGFRILYEAELQAKCRPWSIVQCNLHIERQIAPLSLAVQIQAGSMVEIFVHDDLHDDDHQMALQTEGPSGTDSVSPHVTDRWCENASRVSDDPSDLQALDRSSQHEEDDFVLMQRPTDNSEARVMHHFFKLRSQYVYGTAHPSISFNDVITELWELPSYGPQAIRQLHAVSFPPDFIPRSDYVFILELNEDETRRFYDDEVLCLVQFRFETTPPSNDRRDSFRVIWSPPKATRSEMLHHLRILPTCLQHPDHGCIIEVNHVRWREEDSVIRHFRSGDFIMITIQAPNGDAPEAARLRFCRQERHQINRHVILTDSSIDSSDETPTPRSRHTDSERSRSRSRQRDDDDEYRSPTFEQEDEHDSPSLLQTWATRTTSTAFRPYPLRAQRDSIHHPVFPPEVQADDVASHFQRLLLQLEVFKQCGQGERLSWDSRIGQLETSVGPHVRDIWCSDRNDLVHLSTDDIVRTQSGNQAKVNLDLSIETTDRQCRYVQSPSLFVYVEASSFPSLE